jgi:glutaminyl-tRNA synthetase
MADKADENKAPRDFIRQIVDRDIANGKHGGRVVTRFPPEPNGFLHIGHAKAITIDYGIAEEFGGTYHLRFDDTNPVKEETRYSEAIMQDIKWLGYDWGDKLFHASDYFDRLHEFALRLIKMGKAYVCDLSPDEIREYRGTLTEPGRNSPDRNRSVDGNLDLFARMKGGEFPDGSRTLRAKIDMASGNLNMRDPVIYRILHASHHRTGDKWCIYPMYDFTHCLSDSIEGITHSFCDLDFEDHRPLYDWFLDQLGVHHPQQIEFARLNLSYTVMSKRRLATLISEGMVEGWDDPRLPTLSGLRRRGYTPNAVRKFCEKIGIAKRASIVDIALLEHVLREELNRTSRRVMAVLNPLKVIIDNYPDGRTEELEAINNPEDPSAGTRTLPFSKVLYIEREDFMDDPPKKFFRLSPGREVRLRYAYFIKCESFERDPDTGEITVLHCTYDPATRGGSAPDERKVKATMHWVSAGHAVDATVRLYSNLFIRENPMDVPEGETFTDAVNPESLEVRTGCKLEPSLGNTEAGDRYQFERLGYFCADPVDSKPGVPVFNRTVTLRDAWARVQKNQNE